MDYIIVGLGNPGKEYEKTRHNAGRIAIDRIAEKYGIKINKIKFKGLYGQTDIAGKKVLLLKPETYMNLSGISVSEAAGLAGKYSTETSADFVNGVLSGVINK